MPEASTLQFLFQLAKGIASQFGPNCEVVVHDLDSNDPESSIVAIENGQVTGRKVGDGPSHVVLETLRGDREKLQDHLCYLTKTKDGKILKSTTIYIRNDDGTPIGIFGINGAAVAQAMMIDTLFHPFLGDLGVSMSLWATIVLVGSQITSFAYPGLDMIGQMGLAHAKDIKPMMKLAYMAIIPGTLLVVIAECFIL